MLLELDARNSLPEDGAGAVLVGRAWVPGESGNPGGPSPVLVRADGILDISGLAPTRRRASVSSPAPAIQAGATASRVYEPHFSIRCPATPVERPPARSSAEVVADQDGPGLEQRREVR